MGESLVLLGVFPNAKAHEALSLGCEGLGTCDILGVATAQ